MSIRTGIVGVVLLLSAQAAFGGGTEVDIPMHRKGANTFYVTGMIRGTEPSAFMVDTGSSYMTINEETLRTLQATNAVTYRRDIVGILASGERRRVPIYQVPEMLLGERCLLNNVEVAVFPGRTRQILGLNVLRRTAPFQFSVDPPNLRLSNCGPYLARQATAE